MKRKGVQCKHIPDSEILAACRAFRAGQGPTPDVSLGHKYPMKVIIAKMAKLVGRGVLDYGVSLRTAWVVADEKCRVAEAMRWAPPKAEVRQSIWNSVLRDLQAREFVRLVFGDKP